MSRKCVKCDLHGDLQFYKDGHIRKCPYRQCPCTNCKNHDLFLKIQIEEKLKRKENREKRERDELLQNETFKLLRLQIENRNVDDKEAGGASIKKESVSKAREEPIILSSDDSDLEEHVITPKVKFECKPDIILSGYMSDELPDPEYYSPSPRTPTPTASPVYPKCLPTSHFSAPQVVEQPVPVILISDSDTGHSESETDLKSEKIQVHKSKQIEQFNGDVTKSGHNEGSNIVDVNLIDDILLSSGNEDADDYEYKENNNDTTSGDITPGRKFTHKLLVKSVDKLNAETDFRKGEDEINNNKDITTIPLNKNFKFDVSVSKEVDQRLKTENPNQETESSITSVRFDDQTRDKMTKVEVTNEYEEVDQRLKRENPKHETESSITSVRFDDHSRDKMSKVEVSNEYEEYFLHSSDDIDIVAECNWKGRTQEGHFQADELECDKESSSHIGMLLLKERRSRWDVVPQGLVLGQHSAPLPPVYHVAQIPVPDRLKGFLIGKGGHFLKKIKELSHTFVRVGPKYCTVKGSSGGVEMAMRMIYDRVRLK